MNDNDSHIVQPIAGSMSGFDDDTPVVTNHTEPIVADTAKNVPQKEPK